MTDHAFGDSVKLEFEINSQCKEIEARLKAVEFMFHISNEVSILAGVYSGIKEYII
jgi:hypothetical protein